MAHSEYLNDEMESPEMAQLCGIHMSRYSYAPFYTKERMIEVFLVSIECVALDVAPPTRFSCLRVSLWPVSRGVNDHTSAFYQFRE